MAESSSDAGGGSVGGASYQTWAEIFGKRSHAEKRHARQRQHRHQAKRAATAQRALQAAAPARAPVSSAGIIGALPRVGRPLGALPGTPGAPQPAPRPAPPRATGTLGTVQQIVELAGLSAQVVQQILDWIRGRKAAAPGVAVIPFPVATPPSVMPTLGSVGAPPVAYYQTTAPQGAAMPSIWTGIGAALGQIGTSVLQQIGQPQAYPGGAPIALPGIVPGMLPTTIPTTMPTYPGARRGPSIVVMNGRAYRSLGTPIAWSGDLAAVKRLKRAAVRIGHVIPRRGGGRRRFR